MKKTNARITMYAVPATVYTAAPGIGSLKNVPAGARRRTVSMPAALSAAAPRMINVASQGSMTPNARKAAPYPGSGLHASPDRRLPVLASALAADGVPGDEAELLRY